MNYLRVVFEATFMSFIDKNQEKVGETFILNIACHLKKKILSKGIIVSIL